MAGQASARERRHQPGRPTKAQIRTAVARAERSKSLWATVNICNSKRYPDRIGVRGQMPSLGFAAWLSMDIQVQYYSDAHEKHFVPAAAQRRHPDDECAWVARRPSSSRAAGRWTFDTGPHLFDADCAVRLAPFDGVLLGQTTQA